MNELNYNKELHWVDSISVWLDIDTVLYLVVIILIAYKTMHIIKKKKCISLFTFVKKYSLICALPLFALYAVQLCLSNIYIYKNIVTTILPIIYALIIQCVFILIDKIKKKK